MDPVQPIYTEINNCRDCYKCIRWCPVKAIKVEKDSASIISSQCIFCGRCTLICPAEAKKVRDDTHKALQILANNNYVIASLAPSYITEFPNATPQQVIKAIKMLGFAQVSETALGAELVSIQCREVLNNGKLPFYISSACPSAVELIKKYYPQYTGNIIPVMSPMGAHGQLLNNITNNKAKVVFFSPCIAKKAETDAGDKHIDVSLTFNDLKKWLKTENIIPETLSPNECDFFPVRAASASMYPVDGGMINSIKSNAGVADYTYMSFSGIGNIKKVLNGLDNFKASNPVFLELMACEGGCINGPGSSVNQSLAQKRYTLLKNSPTEQFKTNHNYNINISYNYTPQQNNQPKYSENEILEALHNIGKQSLQDQLNCGGCGYNSCRDFAIAYLDKKAEQSMCVSYMRRIAHDKATSLLQKMPSGVVMVNDQFKIIESNRSFTRILGPDYEELYNINPGLTGADIRKIVPFHKLFTNMLLSGEDSFEKDIRDNGKMLHVTIFSIQKHKVVCGIFRDMYAPEVRRDEVIKRTRKVINENMHTVQQIAYLLGENASRTEAMLNSIIESYKAANNE